MQITGSVALVTGANRGLGREFARQLLERGARTVYAAARRPEHVDVAGVTPLRLDVTDAASVAAGQQCRCGQSRRPARRRPRRPPRRHGRQLLGPARGRTGVRANPCRGGWRGAHQRAVGAVVVRLPRRGGYAASKAAAWALANNLRLELAGQRTLVTAVHLGAADTDMTSAYEGPKIPPEQAVADALDGVENGRPEVLVDDWTRMIKASLAGDPIDVTALGG